MQWYHGALQVFWPTSDIEEGEEALRNYVAGHIGERRQRAALLLKAPGLAEPYLQSLKYDLAGTTSGKEREFLKQRACLASPVTVCWSRRVLDTLPLPGTQ